MLSGQRAKSVQSYLEPNRNRMQKPVEGRSRIDVFSEPKACRKRLMAAHKLSLSKEGAHVFLSISSLNASGGN
jgi:hypothetical protein